nr:MAG TPA: hypothetical protein [Bacteriophage sp.]
MRNRKRRRFSYPLLSHLERCLRRHYNKRTG